MDHKSIERLEHDLELAIADVMERLDKRKFPSRLPPHTLHLMAKAAATVYEAVAEFEESERDR